MLKFRMFFCAVLLAGHGHADDWPRWRGPQGDGHVAASAKVPESLPAEPRFTWRKKIGFGLGSPVVSRGVIYYLDNLENTETVHAADAATGVDRWSVPLDEAFKDNQSPAGTRSTPLVDGDRVYVTSCRGEFRCLDVANGKTIWGVNFGRDFNAMFTGEKGTTPGAGRHGNTGSPMVEGDRIFVAVGGSEGASVVCFNKRDGKLIWKSQSDIPGNGGPVVATVAGRKQVLAFTVDAAVGLDFENGALLWRVPVKTSFGRHVASPIAVGDTVIVGSHQAGLIGIRVARDGDTFSAEPAYTEKRIAINFSSPVVREGFIYGLGPAATIFCADAHTAEQKWSYALPAAANKAHAGFIVFKQNLLVLTDTGDLFLMACDPAAFRLIGKLKVCGENWCNPAYADGRLFLRDKDELLCLELL
jgi:outer membrane protein assembly factor BamB